MRLQERSRILAKVNAQPNLTGIPEYPGKQNNRDELRQWRSQYAGADDEQFQWHGNWYQRRDKHRDQPIALEPLSKTYSSARRRRLLSKSVAPGPCGPEQDRISCGGAHDGESGTEPPDRGCFYRDEDEQCVKNSRYRNARGVQKSQQQDAERSPCDQKIGQMPEQLPMVPRWFCAFRDEGI